MSTASDPLADPELLETEWDLAPLLDGEGEEGAARRLEQARELARDFAGRYAGRVGTLDPEGLATAMRELSEIEEMVGRAGSYASLRFATDTADPERGRLLALVQERATEIETLLVFFELEWAALDDERAAALLDSGALEFCAHHLRSARRYRPHLLSEPEEKILAEKTLTGRAAWARLFGELTSALRVELDGAEHPLEVGLSRLQDGDREVRRAAADAVSAALEPGLRTRAFILNTLLQDKAVEDRLRSYPHWLASRNLANEASDASVQALVEAVRGRYDIPQRWYRLKARLLGLDRLADYDRAAPLSLSEGSVGFREARELVLETYSEFSESAGKSVRRFFDERWIDAPVRPDKRGGAFCSYTVPSVHPYVMLNYTARPQDVLTLAHELGHGLHALLSRPQGVFHHSTPLTLAETASVFGETLVFERLIEAAGSEEERLGLLARRLDSAVGTVFRQIAMNRFEDLVHTRRREQGELSVEAISQAWSESQSELFADSVEISEGYRTWWSYIPHVVNTPGYVYAYAYGQLLALSAYARYAEEGEAFVPRYLDLLAAGGSAEPQRLGEMIGIDLSDPGFWDRGLEIVEGEVRRAELLAERVGPGIAG
jgi:oligoendopeptidase F